ncbi:phosphatidate cytidylyltransferase [Sinomicrobium weinanense]|uniref:Phosphatidate cytidylyltransferase n=1 Tax=Sinomicrobium weinanense TaxID=2842200 RepID=A0A926JRK6_9FLAO|nr:phosphatidate cytidylyltransferase [Sinomicrobium weinanense]MBC9796084.1 phosphatidate cytidylyltransferase [Sinomicrobium weinanense]MBU3124753.1 phosphatidate cytidylyltransferase [Sinomicrobium weinanense]
MKNLLTRSITGILYVFLLLSAVFLSSDAFDFLFLSFGLICIYEFKKLIKLSGYYIFIAFLLLWWLFVHLVQGETAVFFLLFVTLAVNLLLIALLLSGKQFKLPKNYYKFIIALFYIGGGCIFLTMIPYHNHNNSFAKFIIIGIFILVWVNDTFAYIVGKSVGRTKLLASVSPNKTVEGFVGGMTFSLIAAYIIALYNHDLETIHWMILAAVVVITGSLGDLIESKFKRLAGVKDSGAILPGHGGLLDRLDSLIFLAPFTYLTLQLFIYVS